MSLNPTAQKVLDFWLHPDTQKLWFAKSDDFDNQIRTQFFDIWQQAKAGECADWRTVNGETNSLKNSQPKNSLLGRLAEIIVLDQFSRNLARNTPDSFAQDGMALVLAQEAILLAKNDFSPLTQAQQAFLFMPFMHSESAKIHKQALQLFTQLGNPNNLDFEKKHKAIIDRFGRYPHRNAILGRTSTPEELEFLTQADSAF